MPQLLRPRATKEELDKTVKQVEEDVLKPVERKKPLDYNRVVSTGSTLLDLAISGTRRHGGGIPMGIIVEAFGPSSSGKTALLVETATNAQNKGGKVRFRDPEARLDQEYAQIYGLSLGSGKFDYDRPDTVKQLFKDIEDWKIDPKVMNVFCADSLAALSTEGEMKKEDKMGMKRAKDFSEGLRKTCRLISGNDRLIMFTNQIRENADAGPFGQKYTTPGGMSLPFYASLRLQVTPAMKSKIVKKINLSGKIIEDGDDEDDEKNKANEVKKIIGIRSRIYIFKSSVDAPFRDAEINIIFNYGIDDIRGNLEYIKKMKQDNNYMAVNKEFRNLDRAIQYIEDNKLQDKLREITINLWEEIESKFKTERKPKVRW
jgi:RecA/RadA recombinase